MTLARLEAEMDMVEFWSWVAHFKFSAQEEAEAYKRATAKTRTR